MVSTRRTKFLQEQSMQPKSAENPIPKSAENPIPKSETLTSKEASETKSTRDDTLTEELTKLYEDIKSVPSYSAKITELIRHNSTHSLHRRVVKKTFPRRRVITRFPFENFMGDLIEYPSYKFVNNGYQYILVLIDCFTKKVYVSPMKKKNKE